MICNGCKQDKGIDDFYPSNLRYAIHLCKPCHNAKCREWRLNHKEGERERSRRYKNENKETVLAKWRDGRDPLKSASRAMAQRARRNGEINPQPCQVCGSPDAQMHHDDYGKPLEVRWLCVSCHQHLHHQVALSGKGGEAE